MIVQRDQDRTVEDRSSVGTTDSDSEHLRFAVPLAGTRICGLIISDAAAYNARLIKVANAAASAGADVTVVYSAHPDASEPAGSFHAIRIAPIGPPCEHPVWLIRVAVNLMRELVLLPLRLAVAAWRADADIYHAHFLRTLLPAWIASRLRGAALVYDVRDLFIEAAESTWPRWRVRYFRCIERFLAKRADAVIAVSQPMAAYLEAHNGCAGAHVVLNGPGECFAQSVAVSNPVKLFFQGAFRYNRNLPSLIKAMGSLRGMATLTLQGWGDCETELRNLVEEYALGDVVAFRERCLPTEVVVCAHEYDVGVICYKADTINLKLAVPNKLMDYLGAGLAVAVSDLPGHRSIVSEELGCGVLIDPASSDTIARDLAALVSDPDRIAEMKRASIRMAPGLCWDTQAATLIGVYRGLVHRHV